MDLQALTDFNLVAVHGGFGRASRRSGRAKATLSRRVAELEQSLGARLIERGGHTLRLTDEGRTLHERTPALSCAMPVGDFGLQPTWTCPELSAQRATTRKMRTEVRSLSHPVAFRPCRLSIDMASNRTESSAIRQRIDGANSQIVPYGGVWRISARKNG